MNKKDFIDGIEKFLKEYEGELPQKNLVGCELFFINYWRYGEEEIIMWDGTKFVLSTKNKEEK